MALLQTVRRQKTLQQEHASAGQSGYREICLWACTSTLQSSLFLIGFGFAFPQDPPDFLHANSVVVEIFPRKRNLTLYEFGQSAAAALDRQIGDRCGQLRSDHQVAAPQGRSSFDPIPEVLCRSPTTSQSVLTGTRTAGWQVVLQSPDAGYMLVLTFSILGETFEELEPLLAEMVRRVAVGRRPSWVRT